MMNVHSPLRKFPIEIQSFEFLRTEGYLYVDKTAFVYRLATTGKPYFLSRPLYTPVGQTDTTFYIGNFVRELRQGDVEAFLTRLRAFFADFPYELNTKNERHYQAVFYFVFKLMGQFTQAEVKSARGRADAVVCTPGYVYVFEFKLNGTAESALKQIDKKGYLLPYSADGRQLVKVGVSFNAEERNLGKWVFENH